MVQACAKWCRKWGEEGEGRFCFRIVIRLRFAYTLWGVDMSCDALEQEWATYNPQATFSMQNPCIQPVEQRLKLYLPEGNYPTKLQLGGGRVGEGGEGRACPCWALAGQQKETIGGDWVLPPTHFQPKLGHSSLPPIIWSTPTLFWCNFCYEHCVMANIFVIRNSLRCPIG